jgi:hypothetical protein
MTSAALNVRFSTEPLFGSAAQVKTIKRHEVLDRWKPLHRRLDTLSKGRNKLAHFGVVVWRKGSEFRLELRPQLQDARNFSLFNDDKALTREHIERLCADFRALTNDIGPFVDRACELLKQPLLPPQLTKDRPHPLIRTSRGRAKP